MVASLQLCSGRIDFNIATADADADDNNDTPAAGPP
jgi:hypothetical protein